MGTLTLPNADIALTGVVVFKDGFSIKDSSSVERINLSSTGAVTLSNVSISKMGFVTLMLPNTSINAAGLVAMRGGVSVTDSGVDHPQ